MEENNPTEQADEEDTKEITWQDLVSPKLSCLKI